MSFKSAHGSIASRLLSLCVLPFDNCNTGYYTNVIINNVVAVTESQLR